MPIYTYIYIRPTNKEMYNKQTNKQTNTHTNKQTHKQTHIQTNTHTYVNDKTNNHISNREEQNRSVQMLWKMSVIRSSWICNCHKRRKPDGNGFLIDQVHVISSVNAMVKQTALCSLAAHPSGQGRAVGWRERKRGRVWRNVIIDRPPLWFNHRTE